VLERVSLREKLQSRIDSLVAEIHRQELRAKALIRDSLDVGEEIRHLYDDELNRINSQLKKMKASHITLNSQMNQFQQETSSQRITLGELAELTLEVFWKQESRFINQTLHRLMGKNRLLLLRGQIIGVAQTKRHQKHHI
jgi:hypothetical protein